VNNFSPQITKFGKASNSKPVSHGSSLGYVLITGATGLLGQYLLADLFDRDQKIAVLVRSNKNNSAAERIEAIMQRWETVRGKPLPRPVALDGNIHESDLGLSLRERRWVADHCDRLLHNAAHLNFHGDHNSEPYRTNLTGTENVIGFARLTGIRQMHYVSTAYVCGRCERVFSEDELDIGQQFRNDYEQSKFEAEKLVRAADAFDSTTIYRPAVIVGDTTNGFTASYHGLYLYLRLMATLIPHQAVDARGIRQTPIRLPMSGDESRNLVPVNWVSQVVSEIFCNPAAHGRTFHLVPDAGLTPKSLIDYCYEYFGSAGAEFDPNDGQLDGQHEFARHYLMGVQIYSPYDTSDPVFDCRNLKRYCPDQVCPLVDKQVIFRFLDFGIADRWGKRRLPSVQVDNWFESHWDACEAALRELAHAWPQDVRVGFDVLGPGGGQWTLSRKGDGKFHPSIGLAANCQTVLRFSTNQFAGCVRRMGKRLAWSNFLTAQTSACENGMKQSRAASG
jgi:thioester reductase-like protein